MSEHSRGLGTVTEKMVRQRAREIAETNGRRPEKFTESDLDQARSELLGRQSATSEPLEDATEWTDVPGQTGRRGVTHRADDEQTFAEELVEEGVQEAEHEQMIEGNRERRARDLESELETAKRKRKARSKSSR